jgi:ribosomal protein S18 acetylase RimI-like enzyme
MRMELTVRDAGPGDAAIIAAFNSAMAEETEGKSLDPDTVGPGVANVLADSRRGRYWVAENGGAVVGQLMVTYEWSDWRNGNLWWIQSVYVCPDWRRKGVFSVLYRHVESLAATDPEVIGLRLYVEQNNTRAQHTYEALGMVKPHYLVMEALFGQSPANKEK